ncbi:PQQ-binding-like beta-propeller repeat protein [Flavobacterium sp. NKUCC04_CG]|uniref:outer membrane protein assembly factor BamB family protein n=1 Tax=Flavobacterium sp. NKUCC04_CG TaxID=2842121 RepID=UPI001C5BEDD0|nr:PQQ-binding-like beta-propeller repeat protein [Flavobacterium sp. NKUCC04_CG]MBW3520012.1 PQQ-like beta-propeller repeat protein [Flavobacterium sp. NKUCC04_CG]
MVNYNKIRVFNDVYDCFKLNSNSFSYFDSNNIFHVFDFNLMEIADLYFESTALYREFGGDLYFSLDNKLVKLDCSDYSLKTVYETDKEYIVILNDNYDLFAVSEENGVYDNELLVRKNQEYISKWDVARNTSYYYNVNLGKILLFSSFNKLVVDCISIESGEEIWNKEFKVKIQGDILVFKNVLIVPLANNHLLAINTQTGAQLWELDDCFFYYSLDSSRG